MSKEYLEALEILKTALHNEWLRFYPQFKELDEKTKFVDGVRMVSSDADAFLIVRQALQRLEQIDDANLNEALEDLAFIKEKFAYLEYNCENFNVPKKELVNIEQSLLKAQEQEKEKLLFKNIHNTKVKTPLVSIFNGLSKEERYKFTEHLYYNWEEMKEALEEQNKQLVEENIELKKKLSNHYLKWEDLEFTVDWKVMTVKMGDTVYKILYRYCYANEEVQLLSEDKKLLLLRLIGRYKYNIQLFNDLHLEVVE